MAEITNIDYNLHHGTPYIRAFKVYEHSVILCMCVYVCFFFLCVVFMHTLQISTPS